MSRYLGIDPGSTETGYALINNDYSVISADKVDNEEFIKYISFYPDAPADVMIVESMQSYGNIFGKTSIETCYFIGRIIQIAATAHVPCFLYPRPEYARSICGGIKVNDSILRQALINRFGGDLKGEPMNPLRGNSDKRSAFAVAAYHLDTLKYPK